MGLGDGETSSGLPCCGIIRATLWHEPIAGRAAPPRTSHPRERSESRQQGREWEGGSWGEKSPEREVRQVLENAEFSQFKRPERSSERRGQGWAAAARGVNVPAPFPLVCLCHLPTISHNLSPQESAISHSAG